MVNRRIEKLEYIIPSRHGDLILKGIDSKPSNLRPTGNLVLQHGENTGHAHRLQGQVQVFEDAAGEKYFEVKANTQLVHEDHHMIDVVPGFYHLMHEREFDPFSEEMERRVRD